MHEIIANCKDHIKMDIGGLNDLPPELANTIANIYYKFHEHPKKSKELKKIEVPPGMEKYIITNSLEEYIVPGGVEESFFLKNSLKILPDSIKNLRQVKKANLNTYNYVVELLLDVFKYKINNALNKPKIFRVIERKFKKKNVNEIPDLYKKFLD